MTQTWGGDGAQAFHVTWHAGGVPPGPAYVLRDMHDKLTAFADGLRDCASRLENKQHDHWIQLATLAAMTVVNVVQLGADPATDAAAVGIAATMQLGGSVASTIATFAGREAFTLMASDLVGQLGAHVWDSFDSQFEQGVVPVIDRDELATVLPLPACSVAGPESIDGEPVDPAGFGLTADGRLQNADSASIPVDKFAKYSMDPAHPENNGKWRAFQRLGFDVSTEGGRASGAQNLIDQVRKYLASLPAKRQAVTETRCSIPS